jgi:hypothetical protein
MLRAKRVSGEARAAHGALYSVEGLPAVAIHAFSRRHGPKGFRKTSVFYEAHVSGVCVARAASLKTCLSRLECEGLRGFFKLFA